MFLEGVVRLATPRVRNRGLGRRRPSVLRPVGRLDSGRFRIELRFVFCFVGDHGAVHFEAGRPDCYLSAIARGTERVVAGIC